MKDSYLDPFPTFSLLARSRAEFVHVRHVDVVDIAFKGLTFIDERVRVRPIGQRVRVVFGPLQ